MRVYYDRDAAFLQVVGMGVALAAVAHHGHFLVLDQAYVGVTVVIDTHGKGPFVPWSI